MRILPESPLFPAELQAQLLLNALRLSSEKLQGPFSSRSGTRVSESLGVRPRGRSVLSEGDMWGPRASFNLGPSALYI